MLTNMEYVILGILADGPKSGYGIKRVVELSPSIGFSASAGAIYPALKRLESQRLVEGKLELQELRPNKKVYRLTDAGRGDLLTWLKTPLNEGDYAKVQDPLLAKLLFFGLLPKADAAVFLRAQKSALQAQSERAAEFKERFGAGLGFFPRLCLESGETYLRSQIALLEKAEAELSSSAGPSR